MTTKIKLKKKSDGHDVLVLAKHPMETGNRKDKKTGKLVPAHYITTMNFAVNGNNIVEASLSVGVSANPLIGTNLKDLKAGDTVTESWVDNQDGGESAEATVK
jgi:sulfur-oxidizing protein SoxZ